MKPTYSLAFLFMAIALMSGCKASAPGDAESKLAAEAKKVMIGGKDWQNPTPNTPDTVRTGMEHFRHHCQICHGLAPGVAAALPEVTRRRTSACRSEPWRGQPFAVSPTEDL
jgi:mono/diheme cytochrome c family protein